MRVTIRRNNDATWDVKIKRTRRFEGDSVRKKGLSKAEMRQYLETEIDKVAHPLVPT